MIEVSLLHVHDTKRLAWIGSSAGEDLLSATANHNSWSISGTSKD